ncbi:MAG: ORF6N domain-containing protein [Steroidobacteraceae bacterium]
MPNSAYERASGIARQIVIIRGRKVLLDAELAALYGVSTKRFNEQVRRNRDRFPADFMFQLTAVEVSRLRSESVALGHEQQPHRLRSQVATSNTTPSRRGGRRYAPFAFTEHGAIMAATILKSPRAIEMSVYVVRAFVRLRAALASRPDLARKLEALERSLVQVDERTRRQFSEVYAAIRALTSPPAAKRRPIGFTADLDEGSS